MLGLVPLLLWMMLEKRPDELPRLLLTAKEAAALLNLPLSTVYAMKNAGVLRCVKTGAAGRGIRFPVEDIERFVRGA
jgi:excisionase family DNA binding protein